MELIKTEHKSTFSVKGTSYTRIHAFSASGKTIHQPQWVSEDGVIDRESKMHSKLEDMYRKLYL